MTNVEKATMKVSSPRNLHVAHKGRRAIVAVFAVLSAAVLSGVTVGAVAESPPPTRSHAPNATSVVRWLVPHDQSGAPVVTSAEGSSGAGLFGISCSSATECVAVGSDGDQGGVASTSTDGGTTWTQGALASGEPVLFAVDCPSTANCVAVGQGASARSTDGGATWTSSTLPTSNTTLLGVDCPNATLCVSVGVSPGNAGPYEGQLLVSSNGGTTWTVPSLPAAFGALGSIACPSATFCVSVGASILVSNDGGQTWSPRTVNGGTGVLRSVSCESATTCVAIGANPAVAQSPNAAAYEVETTDGGATWTSVTTPHGSATLSQVSCSSSACQAAGSAYNGAAAPMLLTSNGGAQWTADASVASSLTAVNAISCYSGTSCVFVGVGANGTTPVAVSTTNGKASSSDSVRATVRSQKDVTR